jgi:hypothetical protein
MDGCDMVNDYIGPDSLIDTLSWLLDTSRFQ